MPGVRIQHRSARSVVGALPDMNQPLAAKQDPCPLCFVPHTFKTYHLSLDATGSAIVSVEVAERIKRIGPLSGFEITGEVTDPPPQSITFGGPVESARAIVKLDE